jgi:hypothetical protein
LTKRAFGSQGKQIRVYRLPDRLRQRDWAISRPLKKLTPADNPLYLRVTQVDAAKRPYPVTGTWERSSFWIGNLLFLMMSDINEPSQSIGRGPLGGNPPPPRE